MTLTQLQQDIIVGLLLGDGSLEFNGFKGSRLQIKQCESKKEYVFWLYRQLACYVKTPPKQRPDTLQWYFSTRSLRELECYRNIFYVDRIKIVPSNIQDMFLSPVTLAVWFMDDGSLDFREKYHYSFTLSTDSFTVDQVAILQKVLRDRFLIDSTIQTPSCRGKRYTKLYIGKSGRDIFLKTVYPHILSCFAYKIPPVL